MTKQKYDFWLSYRRGEINRELTKKEKSEVRAGDFAAFLLIPQKALLHILCEVKASPTQLLSYYYSGSTVVSQLAEYFKVPEEVMEIRLRLLADEIWS